MQRFAHVYIHFFGITFGKYKDSAYLCPRSPPVVTRGLLLLTKIIRTMKAKVTWYILTNDDGSITIASTNGVRVSVTDRSKVRQAMWTLVDNTADVFHSLLQRGHKEIKFTVEY